MFHILKQRGVLSGLLACALAGLIAACGPVPKPFVSAPDQKVENPLLGRSDSATLVIAPVEGAPADLAGPLAERLAESLRWLDIPASTAPHIARAHLLEGETLWRNGVLVTVWHLTDAAGQSLGQISDIRPTTQAAFETGDEGLIDSLISHAAQEIADLLARRNVEGTIDEARAPKSEEPDVPMIAILDVSGAPGDGNRALPLALAHVIRESGLPFTKDPARAALKLSAEVQNSGEDGLIIGWTMVDRQDQPVGNLDQPVPIPVSELSGRWGINAFDAAIALLKPLAGVLDVIAEREAAARADKSRTGLILPTN